MAEEKVILADLSMKEAEPIKEFRFPNHWGATVRLLSDQTTASGRSMVEVVICQVTPGGRLVAAGKNKWTHTGHPNVSLRSPVGVVTISYDEWTRLWQRMEQDPPIEVDERYRDSDLNCLYQIPVDMYRDVENDKDFKPTRNELEER